MSLKRVWPAFAIPTLMMLLQPTLSFGQERVLRVLNYSEYIDGEVLTLFEEETGIRVIYESMNPLRRRGLSLRLAVQATM